MRLSVKNTGGEKRKVVEKPPTKERLQALGSKLKLIRLGNNGLRLERLAKSTDCSERTLSRLENGGNCSTSVLLEFLQQLGLLESFFFWLDQQAPLPPDKIPRIKGRRKKGENKDKNTS